MAIDFTKLLNSKYTYVIIMLSTKDVFGNLTKMKMYRNNFLVNYKTKFDWYSMLESKELFDAIWFFWTFSIFIIRFIYYNLPLIFEEWLKEIFWKINKDSKNQLNY